MFSQNLKAKYPFLTQYFERGLNNENHSISHSIIFYGSDIAMQYELALEIAKLLNCNEFKNESCQCLNCKWINEKKHPAVLTISKMDNKPDDDDSKTVISIKQSQMIKKSLLTTSEFHRVFIFCDCMIENDKWIPLGLNENNFQQETANSLLKIIEEPPEKTTFFFLTRDKQDLISTIVSRSQSFFVPAFNNNCSDFSIVEEIFNTYPNFKRQNAFNLSQQIFALIKEHGENTILNSIQDYLHCFMKSNLENNVLKLKIINDIKQVENAKIMISSRVSTQMAIDEMCLNITQS